MHTELLAGRSRGIVMERYW